MSTREEWVARYQQLPPDRIREMIAEDPSGFEPAAWDALLQVAVEASGHEARARALAVPLPAEAGAREAQDQGAAQQALEDNPSRASHKRPEASSIALGCLLAVAPIGISIVQGEQLTTAVIAWILIAVPCVIGAAAAAGRARARGEQISYSHTIRGSAIGAAIVALVLVLLVGTSPLGAVFPAIGIGMLVGELQGSTS